VPTSNLEWREDPSNREHEVFGTTSRLQTKLGKTHIHQAKTTWNTTEQYWMLGSISQLSIESKLLYKAILKPIWTYGIQLWGTVANLNIEIIQRFQNKYLRIIVNAAWYITNDTLLPRSQHIIC